MLNMDKLRHGPVDPVTLPALLVGVLPIVTVNLCLLISIEAQTIPSCIPYLEGCTSVSAAGRNPPSIYLFRLVMLPTAAALVLFWVINHRWLNLMRAEPDTRGTVILWLGVIGAVFLGVYVTFLGTEGDFQRLMRRYGIYVFFAFTALSQLLTARDMLASAEKNGDGRIRLHALIILWLCAGMLAMGLTLVVLKAVLADPDPAENVIEWNFAILMQAFFLIAWRSWKHTGLKARMLLDATGTPRP